MIDVERLKHDRDYWDEVGAPEEATHYCPDKAGFLEAWFKDVRDGSAECLLAREEDVWSRVPLTGEPLIPRPTRKQWSGPEDGLPPVGSKVEGYINYGASSRWREVEVLKHNNEEAAVFCANGGCGLLAWCTEFRPLKSEKERVVEAAIKVAGFGKDATIVPLVARRLYDAGALKMPEEDQ